MCVCVFVCVCVCKYVCVCLCVCVCVCVAITIHKECKTNVRFGLLVSDPHPTSSRSRFLTYEGDHDSEIGTSEINQQDVRNKNTVTWYFVLF